VPIRTSMDAPHVHRFFQRSAVLGAGMAPFALIAAVGGFTVWLAAMHSAPSFAAAGWVLGALGVVLGLIAALASGMGLFAEEHRRGAVRGLALGGLAVTLPTLLAVLTLVALAS
jgi:hypothetical protein